MLNLQLLGTKLHQDTWYLDTKIKGNLVGVWIALEDITLESGPFCIYTNADSREFKRDEYNFDDLENDLSFKREQSDSHRFLFLANKGDILIWDSLSIHGALESSSVSATRKSLTAHFYPLGHEVQQPIVRRIYSIYNHENPKNTINKHIKKSATTSPYIYSLMILILKLLGPIRIFIMRDLLLKKNHSDIMNIRRINDSRDNKK